MRVYLKIIIFLIASYVYTEMKLYILSEIVPCYCSSNSCPGTSRILFDVFFLALTSISGELTTVCHSEELKHSRLLPVGSVFLAT